MMNIGFDAKRIFHNFTGLGNYGRTIIQGLIQQFSEHKYYLYTPEFTPNKRISTIINSPNIIIKTPQSFTEKLSSSYWRTFSISKKLVKDQIDLYHGLSHELPFNIQKKGINSVVTIHDLIFMRFPEYYNYIDNTIYKLKVKSSCNDSDKIIAISQQTKNDIIDFFNISPEKIDVIYQSCDSIFRKRMGEEELAAIKKRYKLPDDFILYVGAIIPRKNLMSVVQALHTIKGKMRVPLVIIGKGGKYKEKVNKYIDRKRLKKQVLFMEDIPFTDFPGIYQQAKLFIYPSFFEGFGIPIIEALFSKIPVITSKDSCLPEAGGPDSVYINPNDVEEIGDSILQLYSDTTLYKTMVEKGYDYVQKFRQEQVTKNLMNVYEKIVNE